MRYSNDHCMVGLVQQLLHTKMNYCTNMYIKLMRLEGTNRIVDDSDFKPVDFDRRLPSDSKSNDKSELTIWFQFQSKFDLFQLKYCQKDQKDRKSWLKVNFDQIRPILHLNRTIFDINGPDWNRIIGTSRSDRWNWIAKVN